MSLCFQSRFAAILLAFAIGVIIYIVVNTPSRRRSRRWLLESHVIPGTLDRHYHAAVQIIYEGTVHPIAPNIGITGDPPAPPATTGCNVHAGNANTIHIEAPASQTFTLGQFFAVWSTWSKAKAIRRSRLTQPTCRPSL